MRAIIETKIHFINICYPEYFYIHNSKVSKITNPNDYISKYNLVLDFESPLGKIYVDSNFKSKIILPVIEQISKQNLELNFHNFYLLCSELLVYVNI